MQLRTRGHVLMAGIFLNDVNIDAICFVLDNGSSEHIVNCPTFSDTFRLQRKSVYYGKIRGTLLLSYICDAV